MYEATPYSPLAGKDLEGTLEPAMRMQILGVGLSGMLMFPTVSWAQSARSTRVDLPYSTTVTVPWTWRSSTPLVETALRARKQVLKGLGLLPNAEGNWLLVAAPLADDGEEASVGLMVMPSNLSQTNLVALSQAEIQAADIDYFRPEAERAAVNNGLTITTWEGTKRTTLGGRHALVTRYTLKRPDGPPLRKTTYAVYLGSRAILIHTFTSTIPGTDRGTAVAGILASISIGVDSL